MLQLNNIRMEEFLHDLKFTVLVALVLIYLLDGDDFSSFGNCGLL